MGDKRLRQWIWIFLAFLFLELLNAGHDRVQIFSSLGEAVGETEDAVLLVFFSMDCPLCWDDLFEMKYFIGENQLRVQVVGVSRDSRKKLEKFLEKYAYFEPVVSDRAGNLYRKFAVNLEPFKVILEKNRVLYMDSYYEEFSVRGEKTKAWLLRIGSR